VRNACAREDAGNFKCVIKHGQLDKSILAAVEYVLSVENKTDTEEGQTILNLSGSALYQKADEIIEDYFEKTRHSGTTCDFGGIAMLIEENRTLSDDDSIGLDDDEYYGYVIYRGPNPWLLGFGGFLVAIIGAIVGFVLSMRYSPGFNRRVRSTALFQPLVKSKNQLIRSSCNLGDLYYEEIAPLNESTSAPSF